MGVHDHQHYDRQRQYPDARAWFAHLVELGNEGWEVVGMITLSDNGLPTDGLLAKRPRD